MGGPLSSLAFQYNHSSSSHRIDNNSITMQRTTFFWFSLLFATAAAINYQCLPYPTPTVCIVEHMSYHPGDPVTFPTGYKQYHFKATRSLRKAETKVSTLDEKLYEAMHRPSSIEMTEMQMEELIMPPELLVGNFADNSIASVQVSEGRSYYISYLDLKSNSLSNIDFVSRLVDLEMLHLESNSLRALSDSALRPLAKLKHLYLQHNPLSAIPWTHLPRSLIHLDCYFCNVESVEFSESSLPSLEYLNLQYNDLSAINATALLRAAPNLREAYLINHGIDDAQMEAIHAKLNSSNVSFVVPYVYDMCMFDYDHVYVDGKCVRRQDPSVSTGMAVLLSTLVIGMAVLFVCIVVFVFRHMNR